MIAARWALAAEVLEPAEQREGRFLRRERPCRMAGRIRERFPNAR